MSYVQLMSVKCVQPSSGTSSEVEKIVSMVGGAAGLAAGGFAGTVGATATGGALIILVGLGAAGGMATGSEAAEFALSKGEQWFSGADDLYINVNGGKIWPDDTYQNVDSQQVVQLDNKYFDLSDSVTIELMEYDWVGSDDNMGGVVIHPGESAGYVRLSVVHPEHNSIYEIEYEVVDN